MACSVATGAAVVVHRYVDGALRLPAIGDVVSKHASRGLFNVSGLSDIAAVPLLYFIVRLAERLMDRCE